MCVETRGCVEEKRDAEGREKGCKNSYSAGNGQSHLCSALIGRTTEQVRWKRFAVRGGGGFVCKESPRKKGGAATSLHSVEGLSKQGEWERS